MFTLPNYQITNQIYESVKSVVYRGMRKQDNQPVILKVLKEEHCTIAELARYRHEYEVSQQLNIAYRLEKYQNTLVLISKDFGGESLKYWMGHKSFTLEEFLQLAIAMTDRLGSLHAAHLVHNKITPANAVWNPKTQQLEIIDFGMVSGFKEKTALKSLQQLLEYLHYLSPEQTGRMNRGVDWRSDLYSLGVIFYEMLTGRIPFDSEYPEDLLCHLVTETSQSVCDVQPEVPLMLSKLVMKLMAKNAEDRYQSAVGIKADLENCLQQLISIGKIDLFPLAQHDFSPFFQIPQKLYGRKPEINILLQAYERVSAGALELMLVTGHSGIGKSALVYEMYKPMTKKGGYFVSSKFDQFQRNIPYSAVSRACNDFCCYLLTKNPERLMLWQKRILNKVGHNGQLLFDIIPQLEKIIGSQPVPTPVEAQEAQNRFQRVFRQFFQAICRSDHPFILFLDDLQWADSASLTLLESLLTDHDNNHLLVIGAYRDNEVDPTHPLLVKATELKNNAIVNIITLTNLSPTNVKLLIAETLACQPTQVADLAKLVYQKTQGNAFFVKQFLNLLHQQELLSFDPQMHQWQWELDKIKAQEPTENVTDLLAKKLGKLPFQLQTIMKLASAIDNRFNLETLSIATENSPTHLLGLLEQAIVAGLLFSLEENWKNRVELGENPTNIYFQFQHDHIQHAAYSLIPESERPAFHLQVGQRLLAHRSEEQLKPNIFQIVNQLNRAISIIEQNQVEKFNLATLNLQAGQKAIEDLAFPAALSYMRMAMGLLENDAWQQHQTFCLQLYTQATKAAFLNVDFEQMEAWGQLVLQRSKTRLERLKIYEVQIEAYSIQDQLDKALSLGLAVLKKQGTSFPEKPTDSEIGETLLKTKALLTKQPQLSDLRQLDAPDKLIIMRIVSALIYVAYIKAPGLLPLLTCFQVDFSIKHGYTPDSAVGYIVYGGLLCLKGDIKDGFEFSQQGLRLVEQFPHFESRIIATFESGLRHWKEHLRDGIKPLLKGYQSGLEFGDFLGSGISAATYCMNLYFIGKELTSLEQEIVVYNHSLAQLKQDGFLAWTEITQQAVLNLMGHTSAALSPYHLSGKVFNEDKRTPLDNGSFAIMYLNKLILSYLFHAYPQAIENAALAESYLGIIAEVHRHLVNFYDSLTRLAMYLDSSPQEQSLFLKKVAANQDKMQLWAYHAPMNFLHKFDLVEAERCRVLGKDDEAEEFYNKAIEGAQENGYLNEEALAYELAGQFYVLNNSVDLAQVYLHHSHQAYQRWGAQAKVKDLEHRYPRFLKPGEMIPSSSQETITTLPLAKSAFLVKIAHEKRLLLNSILDVVTTMQAAPDLPPKFKLQVEPVIQQTQYLQRLINNLGDVLKMVMGQMTLSKEDFDLYQLLEEINQLFAKKAKESQFKIEVAPSVPQYIHLDRDKLRQVLIYLVENALNFTLKGEITLSVEASLITKNPVSKPEGPSKYQLSFRVTDTGTGMVKERYHKLVERFKMNPDIAMGYALQEESGLGLSISHYLIHQMKGYMTIVHSEMDQGSTFQFEVPTNEAIAFKLTQSHHRMLIVADKNKNRQPLFDLLISLGFDWYYLQKASSEHEVRNILAYWPLDLIWMDIETGNRDGIEMTRLIKANPVHKGITVVLMMSATEWEQRRDEALSAGCSDCLIRPFEPNEVLDIIEKQLGVREDNEEELDEVYKEEDTTLFMSTLGNFGAEESMPTSVLDFDSSMVEVLMTLPDELLNELLTQAFHTTGYKDFLLELFAQFREQDKFFAKTFDSKVHEEAYYAKLTFLIFQLLRRHLH